MDRFEVVIGVWKICQTAIYIPVWIDLKCPLQIIPKNLELNLHSSMDRFEVDETDANKTAIKIYIPVWIDLKPSRTLCASVRTIIYIPVWIDLKRSNTLLSISKIFNLHSSMDRFEELSRRPSAQQHSHLHSSMDRFEEHLPKEILQNKAIYIPVWIDLKFRSWFQYT